MANLDKNGNWIDARGQIVPAEYVKPLDKKRDTMVTRQFKKLLRLEQQLVNTKDELTIAVNDFLKELSKEKRVKENWKGNITIDSFDGSMRIERSIDDVIGFNEQLQLVKTLINKWISERLGGVDENLAKVINGAFQVNKKGQINTALLMRLFQYDIDDPEWKRAMKLLRESIDVKATKQYYAFSLKDVNGKTRSLCLSFNSAELPDQKTATQEEGQ